MKNSGSVTLAFDGYEYTVLLKKFQDKAICPMDFVSNDICENRLLLGGGLSIAEFKAEQRTLHRAHLAHDKTKFPAWLNKAALAQFNVPYQKLLEVRKSALRSRYDEACRSTDIDFRISELTQCAFLGHVQANIEIGHYLELVSSHLALTHFIDAHDMGHPEGLLYAARSLLLLDQQAPALQALLAGAWGGNVRCAQLLHQLATEQPQMFTDPHCLAALKEGIGYNSLLAKYLLGYLFRHGDESYRDEEQGRKLLKEAELFKHYRADNGKGTTFTVDGRSIHVAGTLAHLESLIDKEMVDIRTKENAPIFEELVAEHLKNPRSTPEDQNLSWLSDVLKKTHPGSPRIDRRIADWLNSDTEIDEQKRNRMRQELAIDAGQSS